MKKWIIAGAAVLCGTSSAALAHDSQSGRGGFTKDGKTLSTITGLRGGGGASSLSSSVNDSNRVRPPRH